MKHVSRRGGRPAAHTRLSIHLKSLVLAASGAILAGSAASASVPSSDVTLQAPVQGNMPIFSPLCGYTANESVMDANKDIPLFSPYDSSTDAWWDNLVAELLQARITNVSFATRGSYTTSPGDLNGPGNMNPRRLKQFVDAVNRAGVASMFKVACFLDAPSTQSIYTNRYGLAGGTLEDMANNSAGVTNHWQEVWWLRYIKPWFDTVPQSMWFLESGGHPRMEFWGQDQLTTNRQGNYSGMVDYISSQMQTTYGVTPVFVGASADTTFATDAHVIGSNPWFQPPNAPFRYTTTPGTGYTAGTVNAGFIDPNFFIPGAADYQNWNRVIRRNKPDGTGVNGDTSRGRWMPPLQRTAIIMSSRDGRTSPSPRAFIGITLHVRTRGTIPTSTSTCCGPIRICAR
jgi:hypothetical protein